MKLATILCTLILAAAANAQTTQSQSVPSEPYVWKNVKVVAGGFIPNVVFSRAEKGLAYCRTDIGGCYRWEDADKKWLPMTDDVGVSNYFGGESIAPDPVDPNVVYMAAGMYFIEPAAMMRSRDRGKTWDIFPVPFRMGGNEDGRGVGERLAVDPCDTRVLYFGSRHDGLWKSTDSAATWQKVESFPIKGLGTPSRGQRSHTGLSCVVFDPTSGGKGSPCKTIFVTVADPGEQHLFRSDDAGQTWQAVAGQPAAKFLPMKMQLDDAGVLYLTYGTSTGPNGVADGAVWKLDTHSGTWTDISPDKRPDRGVGGYCGLALDRQHPGALAVTTLNRWKPGDTVWRSTDGGQTWRDIYADASRDVSLSPYLYWGKPDSSLGWWTAALAIDPFNSDRVAYATGATMYASDDFTNVSAGKPTHWHVWGDGIEETAIITMTSPTEGAHLLSGFGDIGGFVHDDLDVSPPQGMYENPRFNNTDTLDYAANKPSVIVRSGRPGDASPTLAYSEDGGKSWQPMLMPPGAPQAGGRFRNVPALSISADGETFMLMTRTPMFTRDRGKIWAQVSGLPDGSRPVADRVDPKTWYAITFAEGKIYTSTDGGATFAAIATTGLPADVAADQPTWREAPWPFVATLGKQGDLWLVSKSGLFHSADAGKTFSKSDSDLKIDSISLGKAAPGKDYPALFAIGTLNDLKAIWRSDDAAKSWVRVNDDQHQYGTRFRCISGDPRIFGRVYVGTDGRGILYGDRR